MKLIAALAVSVSLLVAQSEHPALHSVTAVRHWSLSGVTRVAIEVDGDFRFRSDRLHNPERIYFDILDARPHMDARRFYSETVGGKLVTRIRAAETVPGVTRVVLELGGDVEATTSQLANPNRLIVELRAAAAGPAAPPQTASALPVVKPSAPKLEPPAPKAEPPAPIAEPPALKAEAMAVPRVEPPAAKLGPPVETAPPPVSPVEIPKPAKHTSTGNNSLTRALGLKLGRIVIDAGHGGHDQGTEGPKGLLEKDLVLDVALRLGKLVEDRMGAEVIYTRTDDTFVPLKQRTDLANEKKADLFLSIHANSSPYPRIAGIETYYLNFTDSKEALDVAARERQFGEIHFRVAGHYPEDYVARQGGGVQGVRRPRSGGALCVFGAQRSGGKEPRSQEGSLCGADRRQHALRAGGDRIPQQPARGGPSQEAGLPPETG